MATNHIHSNKDVQKVYFEYNRKVFTFSSLALLTAVLSGWKAEGGTSPDSKESAKY